jgi:hypothetical protein
MALHRAVQLSVPPFTIACAAHVVASDALFLLPDLLGRRLPRALTGAARRAVSAAAASTALVALLAQVLLCRLAAPSAASECVLAAETRCHAVAAVAHVALLAWTLVARGALSSTRGRWRSSFRCRVAVGSALATSFVLLSERDARSLDTLQVLLVYTARRAVVGGRWGEAATAATKRSGTSRELADGGDAADGAASLNGPVGGAPPLSLARAALLAGRGAVRLATRRAGALVELAVRARVARTALLSLLLVSSRRCSSEKADVGALLVALALPLPLR